MQRSHLSHPPFIAMGQWPEPFLLQRSQKNYADVPDVNVTYFRAPQKPADISTFLLEWPTACTCLYVRQRISILLLLLFLYSLRKHVCFYCFIVLQLFIFKYSKIQNFKEASKPLLIIFENTYLHFFHILVISYQIKSIIVFSDD